MTNEFKVHNKNKTLIQVLSEKEKTQRGEF